MTINENPSGLPEQEPISPTTVVLCGGETEPDPWLRGDELKDVMSTLKDHDVVTVEYKGHTATGDLWPEHGCLVMWGLTVRTSNGEPGLYVDALRIIERAPAPGADIPDEVVDAALAAIPWASVHQRADLRAALAAADAKRAELAGGVA